MVVSCACPLIWTKLDSVYSDRSQNFLAQLKMTNVFSYWSMQWFVQDTLSFKSFYPLYEQVVFNFCMW